MRREVRFEPGYDRVGETDGKYGRGSMVIRFLLHGNDGAVQFVMSTGWLPTHVVHREWGDVVDVRTPLQCLDGKRPIPPEPNATDIGHHWRTPSYDGEWKPSKCDVVTDGDCYYDGSGSNAETVMAAFFQRGDVAVWEALEEYYAQCKASADEYASERAS